MQDEITDMPQDATASQRATSNKAAPKPRTAKRRKWYRRWWAWCLWLLLALILAVAMVAAWAWTQRYALLEDLAVDALADQGIDAQLKINRVTRTSARLTDIRLTQDGATFLRMDEARAEYQWRDAVKGQFERLDFTGVQAVITLDADWKIADGWLPPGLGAGGDNDAAAFPIRGIGLIDGDLTLTSPLGEARLYIDAEIADVEHFNAEITLAPSDLSYAGLSAEGAGVAEISRNGAEFTVAGQVQTDRLSNTAVTIRDAHLRADGVLNLTERRYRGAVSVDGKSIDHAAFAADALALTWDGFVAQITPDAIVTMENVTADGTWTVGATRARTPLPARADAISDTLSLRPALSVVPVTENYAAEITRTVRQFLVGADARGAGTLLWDAAGFTVAPTGPVTLEHATNRVVLTPNAGKDFYAFDRSAQSVSAQMDAVLRRPVGLALRGIALRANSPDGLRLDGVQEFSAQVKTTGEWLATSVDGDAVRLGPLNTRAKYNATNPAKRLLTLDTALDYDGPLPGGVVDGLKTRGRLDVTLLPNSQILDYIPAADTPITLTHLQTPTDWVAEDVTFTLPSTRGIFTRTANQSKIAATLQNPDFIVTRPALGDSPAQRLALRATSMDVAGTILPDPQQDWAVAMTDVEYQSDTMPGPETRAQAAQTALTARLLPDRPVEISLASPAVQAQTPLVIVRDMAVELGGTPETYVVRHDGGRVRLVGSAAAAPAKAAGLDEFPVSGTVNFQDGQFTGQAEALVAKADNAAVSVNYTYGDGAGIADIDIPAVNFTPNGLQPQALAPALRGKIARVTGKATAQLHVKFADGALTDSSGKIAIVDMNFGTAPGPLEGANTEIELTSLYPIKTQGQQTLTVKTFNPGIELLDGTITYELIPEGIEVSAARWPLGEGAFSLDPFVWQYNATENRVVLRLENVGLATFLENIGNGAVKATGDLEGVFPVVISGINVTVDKGYIRVKDGGVIQYEAKREAAAAGEANEYAGMALDALKNFEYNSLFAEVDGPLDGEIIVGIDFDGQNKKVLNGQPFAFDVSLKGELFNILRSFNSNAQIKSEVLRQTGLTPDIDP